MSYAGDLTPTEAWEVLEREDDAVLVDVRTQAEWAFVGVPDTSRLGKRPLFAEWTSSGRGPDPVAFVDAIREHVDPGAPVVLLCRSGQRSAAAAQALTAAGLGPAYNVTDGFEGPVDEHGHRGAAGWRADGLPWRQQ
jgi:rhodanese-related sulfurtransferase